MRFLAKIRNNFLYDVLRSTTSSVLTAITISVLALAVSDYFLTPPRISGLWEFTVVYEDTSYNKFHNLKVTYQAALVQSEMKLQGSGDKYSEQFPDATTPIYYDQPDRIPITINGYIERKFLGQDKVFLYISEKGKKRDSSAFHELNQQGDGSMTGTFYTTIANTSGPVIWKKP